MDAMFRVVGVVSVLVTWLAISYILLRQPRNPAQSISHHAARGDKDYLIFAGLMTVGVLALFLYMVKWLAPTFNLPTAFTVITCVAVGLELIATWVPLTEGRKYTIHQACSYGAAFLLPILLVQLLFAEGLPVLAWYSALAAVLVMIAFMALFKLYKPSRMRYLWYQSIYVFMFHLAVLAPAAMR